MKGINRRWHGYPLKQLFYFTWWELSKKSSLTLFLIEYSKILFLIFKKLVFKILFYSWRQALLY
ncbi:hypothetical protein HPHPH43_0955 [Helicobacter pylori Hp H-43]|nr:hypothetical protein HPHPH43_0955 [Helicobacter pylori Hp H-43]